MLRSLILAVALGSSSLVSGQAFADGHRSAKGTIFYALPSDRGLAERDVVLTVTRDDQGAPVVHLQGEGLSLHSKAVVTRSSRGANAYYVVFENVWDGDGDARHLLLKGRKVKSGDGMIFHGNVYKTSASELDANGTSLDDCIDQLRDGVIDQWSYAGGFLVRK